MVNGKAVVQGMKLTQEKCDQVNAIERNKMLPVNVLPTHERR